MKTNRSFAPVCGSLIAAASLWVHECQANPFEYLAQALSRVVATSTLLNLGNYDYIPGPSIHGLYLAGGQSQGLRLDFERGVHYVVIAAGDEDVEDLDLEARTAGRALVASDTDSDPTPIIEFTPDRSERMTLTLRNCDGSQDGFCAMVILREVGRGGFSLREVTEALGNVLQKARVAGLFSTRFAESTFCLFGGRLNQGAESSLFDVQTQPGSYVLLGAGSDNIVDADLTVVRQYRAEDPAGTVIAQDLERDNTPICAFAVTAENYYCLRYKNYASEDGGSGFVFCCLLQQ